MTYSENLSIAKKAIENYLDVDTFIDRVLEDLGYQGVELTDAEDSTVRDVIDSLEHGIDLDFSFSHYAEENEAQ